MLDQHLEPLDVKHMRGDCLRIHEVIGSQFNLGIDIWLVKLVILLEPDIATGSCTSLAISDQTWLTNRLIICSRLLQDLRNPLRHKYILRWIVNALTLFWESHGPLLQSLLWDGLFLEKCFVNWLCAESILTLIVF